jgi:hypothetical protein
LDGAQAGDPAARVASVDWADDVTAPDLGYGPLLVGRGVVNAAVVFADITEPDAVLAGQGAA